MAHLPRSTEYIERGGIAGQPPKHRQTKSGLATGQAGMNEVWGMGAWMWVNWPKVLLCHQD